ncbi:MAG: helix-turn-helix domain-containing protein [Bacteroidales bacterium]|nr:helix-turn-helix domain-containing protein [Lentimicrobiaceae bacterium]MDD5694430.1 helix-turn-helix domain-containing protein [Bacteroidales bacterium]
MDELTLSYEQSTTLRLKNMTSHCCIRIVREELEKLGVKVNSVSLGEVDITYNVTDPGFDLIQKVLAENGFELIQNREEAIVEQIKIAVIELIHLSNNSNSIIRNSDYLVDKIQLSYQYLSNLFSQHEKITLEKFIILHKIEKVKELISYDELTLSEIAFQMGYSSVQYLSTQFKNVTGMSVTEYKKDPVRNRVPLDDLLKKE